MGWRELLPARVVGDGLIQFLYPNLKWDRDPQNGCDPVFKLVPRTMQ